MIYAANTMPNRQHTARNSIQLRWCVSHQELVMLVRHIDEDEICMLFVQKNFFSSGTSTHFTATAAA